MFLPISTHFTATLGIPLSSPVLKTCSFFPITGLSPELLRKTYLPACAPFTPNDSGQRSPPTYYRGCWHVVSRGFLDRYRHYKGLFTLRTFVPINRALRTEILLHSRGVAPSGFRPLPEDSLLLPPVGVWAVSQSQCGRSPSQVGYASCLGRPLPHQLANAPQSHLIVLAKPTFKHQPCS